MCILLVFLMVFDDYHVLRLENAEIHPEYAPLNAEYAQYLEND